MSVEEKLAFKIKAYLKPGENVIKFHGTVCITDKRLLFIGEVPFAKIKKIGVISLKYSSITAVAGLEADMNSAESSLRGFSVTAGGASWLFDFPHDREQAAILYNEIYNLTFLS